MTKNPALRKAARIATKALILIAFWIIAAVRTVPQAIFVGVLVLGAPLMETMILHIFFNGS